MLFGTCDWDNKRKGAYSRKGEKKHSLTINCVCAKLREWEEQQACWESQKDELEQRVEYGAERVDKLEK